MASDDTESTWDRGYRQGVAACADQIKELQSENKRLRSAIDAALEEPSQLVVYEILKAAKQGA